MKCRLCKSESCSFFGNDGRRNYYRCNSCTFVFVSSSEFISPAGEKERYRLHTNTLTDSGYVSYLNSVAGELHHIPVSRPEVLDYGCGEHAVLTGILQKRGINTTPYDPLYTILLPASEKKFDIIILCEVIEHFRDIRKEAALIRKLVKPEGYILIRTALYREGTDFLSWWYTKDCTHINFFSLPSLQIFGKLVGRKVFYTNEKNVVILSREGSANCKGPVFNIHRHVPRK